MSESGVSARSRGDDDGEGVATASDREVDALLDNLPSAHGRGTSQGATGALGQAPRWHAWKRKHNDPAKRARRASRTVRHIRFVYFGNVDDNRLFGEYHHELVTAEVLLDRVLAARASGMKAVHPNLESSMEDRLFLRPPRGSFTQVTPEYIRWYGRDGAPRKLPMVKEELAIELMGEYAYSYEDALVVATNDSGALARTDQEWLLARAKSLIDCRPLHATEFRTLARAIEAAYGAPPGDRVVAEANIEIARRAAATLGAAMDEYVAPPFRIPELARAFADFHGAHLSRVAEACRLASILPISIMGVLGWFSAKRARIHAEVQARMAAR